MNTEMITEQMKLEEESLGLGMTRYREALASRGEDNLPPGLKLIKTAMVPLTAAIKQCVAEGLAGKASRSVGVIQYLSQFEPDAVAFMTAKTCIHHLGGSSTLQAVAMELATRLEGMVNYGKLKETDIHAYKRLMKTIKDNPSMTTTHKHVIMKREQGRAGIVTVKWGVGEKAKVGTMLIHMLCETTGLVSQKLVYVGANKSITVLVAPDETLAWLEQSHARCELLAPFYMPMLSQPLPWSAPYGGGYLTKGLRYPLIKTGNKNYLEELSHTDMPMVYQAVNALQDTAWTINKAVLNVLVEVWDGGGRIGKLPTRKDEPLPARLHDDDTVPDPEALKVWKRKAAKIHDANDRNKAQRVQLSSKIWVAEKFSEHEQFFFPHALDWRGRAYPVSAGVNPQGNDVSKALLKFADGKALGENGAYWLAVHGANCFGVDKVSYEERVEWVGEHHQEIINCALDPIGSPLWQHKDCDSPYQFLAFCFEWLGYSMSGDAHISHLPISFDGTCNGLQNFSAMLRDEIGGAATGLVPGEKPSDIYTVVRDRAHAIIAQDALGGSVVASRWQGKVTRQLTKQNTMTVPYGVSKFGMKDQLLAQFQKLKEDGVDFGFETKLEDALYLSEVNWQAINQTVVAARAAMDWLQVAAQVAASNDLPISWVTPSGLPVLQSYRKMIGQKFDFDIEGKRYRMTLKIEEDKLDRRKQASGISPNFVHGMDAAHMTRTVCYSQDAGVSSFGMVHDSFATHACDADELSLQLRRSFVDQYSEDVLGNFRDQLIAGLPPELADKIPPLPAMGNLDLQGVLTSDYFFS